MRVARRLTFPLRGREKNKGCVRCARGTLRVRVGIRLGVRVRFRVRCVGVNFLLDSATIAVDGGSAHSHLRHADEQTIGIKSRLYLRLRLGLGLGSG